MQNRREDVKTSLLAQLSGIGASTEHHRDLVDDYMSLWDVKERLIEDIADRGVTFKDKSSVGVEMQKNNPSVKELVMVNKQMLSILKEMNLSTQNAGEGDDDEL